MDKKIIEIAAAAMKVSAEEAEKHCKKIDEPDAYYFWNPQRGGISVIVDDSGEKLAATSSVSFEKHKNAFISGRRN